MPPVKERLDLRLSAEDKQRIQRAAAHHGIPIATFVRAAALREADSVFGQPPATRGGGLAERLRGRATAGMSTDDILRLTRSA